MTNTAMKSKLIPTLISVFCFGLCCYLGAWQLQRLDYKNYKLSSIENAINSEAQSIDNLKQDNLTYTKIKIKGRFLPDSKNLYVFARQKANNREQGYIVLSPFQMTNGKNILVSRGITSDSNRVKISNPTEEVEVNGILLNSEVPQRFDPNNVPDRELWFIINLPQISTYFSKDFGQYYLMQLSKEQDQHIAQFLPEKLLKIYNPHLGYAITWFGIAIAIAVIYIASVHPHLLQCRRKNK